MPSPSLSPQEKDTAVFGFMWGCAGTSLGDAAPTDRSVGKAWLHPRALTRGNINPRHWKVL